MNDRDQAIQQFMELTGVDNDIAVFYLESAKWDIEGAIASYYNNDMEDQEDNNEFESVNLDTENNQPAVNHGLNNVSVGINQNIPIVSKKQDKITTFSSLKQNDSDDENEEKGQAFYVGGSERGGGQQVLGPSRVSKKNQNEAKIQELFKSAQVHGAERITDEFSDAGPSSSCKIFSGSGQRLGDKNSEEIASSVPTQISKSASQPIKVNVKIWSNGFSIDDGPLRTLTEPNDVEFLHSLSTGQIPTELLRLHKYSKIDLNMEDHSSEEYKTPPKRKVVPFQGTGKMLGAPVPNIISSTVNINQKSELTSPIHVDESLPITQLQIRLADNSKLVVRMNYSHTVGDIRNYILSLHPQYRDLSFNLMTTFPNKILDNNSVTLQDANLLNAVIVQRLV